MAGSCKRPKIDMGYDTDRFSSYSDEELEEFKCKICLAILRDPMETPCCRQTFCRVCIEEWLRGKSSPTCTMCRQKLHKNNLIESSKLVKNLIDGLKIDCEYTGCQSVVKLGQLSKHLEQCKFRPDFECEDCGFIRKSPTDHDCVTRLKTSRDELIAALDDAAFELASEKSRVARLERDRSEFIDRISKLNGEVSHQIDTIIKQNDVIQLLQHVNSCLKSECGQLNSKVSSLQSELNSMVQQILL